MLASNAALAPMNPARPMVAVSTVAPGLHDRYERYHPRMREINTLDLLLHVMQHHTAFEGERAQMRN